jgi:hypothetical protein
MMLYKYIVKNVARKHGKTAPSCPSPSSATTAPACTPTSLWKKGKPLFAGNEYAGLSQMALYYIGGLLKHARALCAICNPTTNSYKRLVPGYEAPVNLAYSAATAPRPFASRPTAKSQSQAHRVSSARSSANPYLCFAALLMAGLDGILNKIDPGEPMDKNLYELPPEELAKVPQVPGSLGEALAPGKRPRVPAQRRRLHHATSSTCGSATNARSTTPCACARIRTSSSSTTTCLSSNNPFNTFRSPAANAAVISAARFKLCTVSTRDSESGTSVRASLVLTSKSGINVTKLARLLTGKRTHRMASPTQPAAVNPPYIAGAALSGCRSNPATKSKSSSRLRPAPNISFKPATTPNRTVTLEPKPLAAGTSPLNPTSQPIGVRCVRRKKTRAASPIIASAASRPASSTAETNRMPLLPLDTSVT